MEDPHVKSELEERTKKAETRVIELEKEVEMRKKEYEELEAKFRVLEAKNKSVEAELKTSTTGDNEITRHWNSVEDQNQVDLTEIGDRENVIDRLMTQNHVFECEKREAKRGGKLVLDHIVEGEKKPDVKYNMEGATGCVPPIGIDNLRAPGKRYKDSASSYIPIAREEGVCSRFEGKYQREVKRHLSFDIGKNVSPSTLGTNKPADFNVINVFDSDDESDSHVSTEHVLAETLDGKEDEIFLQDYEEDVNKCRDKVPSVLTSKRKRVSKMVTSDTESDKEDDNVPIAKLMNIHNPEKISKVESSDMIGNALISASHSRRRLVTLRKSEEKVTKQEQVRPISDDEPEEVGSESEGESLDGFIVNISDVSSPHDVSRHSEDESDGGSSAHEVSNQSDNDSDGSYSVQDVLSHSENESEGLDEILCKLERSKDGKKCKWEFEAEMLSAFGKDLELCMRAVCALYRQQTCDEQLTSRSMHENGRGFSKIDALRGSELAEFLIDGDTEGDLKKSKQQLEEYGSSAVDLCRTLATHYSKQLFEIYKNKEDPLFLPF
ncbi:hypothetical protein M5689_017968 [Euphorbia peplus]|nr:hypothetical protein M5689_017968 [Euphorbia peplus]